MIAESLAQFNAMRKCSADEYEAKSRLMSSIELSLMREIEELKESKRKIRKANKILRERDSLHDSVIQMFLSSGAKITDTELWRKYLSLESK
jgi:hypothetical protein